MTKTNSIPNKLDHIELPDLDAFYTEYRDDFIGYAKKHNIPLEDIKDVYQDAVIALYENIRTGKLTKLTSSLKTYLFSIGRHLMLNKIRDRKKMSYVDDEEMKMLNTEDLVPAKIELSEKQELLLSSLKELNGSCQELLDLFFYQRNSIDAIMHKMGYKNENTVKAHKSRCQKKLKELCLEKIANSRLK